MGHVAILMATFNGGAHLAEQLASFAAQSHGDWQLIVADDGSKDRSRAILAEFAAEVAHPVTVLDGPGRGLVRNFFFLLQNAPDGVDFAALSDQDDVWFDDKIARAVERLARVPAEEPALYCARSLICDSDLRVLGPSRRFHRPTGFRNALVQSVGGGNTMVLNRAAIALVRAAVAEAEEAAVHDWWLYQIITACGGHILRDEAAVLHYRQHGGNAIGANTALLGRLQRIRFVLGRRFAGWNDINLRALAASAHRFTPDAAAVLHYYAAARQGGLWQRLRSLRRSGVYRQSRMGTVALYLACLTGRL